MKVCKKCLLPKTVDEYDTFTSLGKVRVRHSCKQCISDAATRRRVHKKYGIAHEQYESLLEKQQKLCAICKTPYAGSYQDSKTKRFAVDHDHETGLVRGLLCSCCNTGLGQFKDSIERLKLAIEYLDRANTHES
jgi:hypothetical protein